MIGDRFRNSKLGVFFGPEALPYAALSVFSYLYILGAIYFLVEILEFQPQSAYALTYITSYLIDYLTSIHFVFRSGHSSSIAAKYIGYLAGLYLCNNFLFFLSHEVFKIDYRISTVAIMVGMIPIKYFVQKLYVFRKN